MIDITKKYKTRGGLEVRIYAVDGYGEFCVHGAIRRAYGWITMVWTAEGYAAPSPGSQSDLVEQPLTQTYYRRKWVKFPDGSLSTKACWYLTKEEFDATYSSRSKSEEWETIEI